MMEGIYLIVRFFQNGGPFMYPIALVLMTGLAVVAERWLFLDKARRMNRLAFEKLLPLLQKQDLRQVMHLAAESSAPVARMVAAGIGRMSTSRRRDDIESAMQEGAMETIPALERRTGYLATLANVATLLGLLGTIIGLIAAFTAVAQADPTEKATLLSTSISVAMNTTAFGLISAIPLLMFHAMLVSRTTEIVDSLDMAAVKCLNLLTSVASASGKAA
ncbi:MAG: MotA/TolQ/ExbB proton channel family protein [Pseudomonadales bacterium]|nr:MotA/TolQ/ExbB proton channel family protein [Pseudomonadales bacterium]